MLNIFKLLFLTFGVLFINDIKALETDWNYGNESQVRLISPITHIENKSEIYLGLEYKLNDGWKTYWKSPGDGGFPQEINFNESQNIKTLEVLWPTPKDFEILGIQSIGYSKSVIFPLKIILNDSSKEANVNLDLNYLVCKHICIPGNAKLELTIPNGNTNLTEHYFIIEKTLSQLPTKSLDISFIETIDSKAYLYDEIISLELIANANTFFENPNIFLHTDYGLPVVKPEIILSPNSKNLKAVFKFKKNLITKQLIKTHFVLSDKNQSIIFEKNNQINSNNFSFKQSSLLILFIAFLGGLILNAMPCVLPILSIKLLSILNSINDNRKIRISFILTSFGIITSFSFLAIFFILLRNFGVSVGWGMQFQNPLFLMFISLILGFFILNLFGFFELQIPNFLNNKNFSKLHLNHHARDFFNGFFITIMATPCSAPFVGTAITAAFTQSYLMMFLIFLFMSIGMSLPYLIISLFPKLLNFLPKPGIWMIYLKYFLGFLLLLTLIWLSNILLNHFNYYFILISLLLFIGAFLLNNFLSFKKTISIIFIFIFFMLPNFEILKTNYFIEDSEWLDFNNVNIRELIEKNNIVFVDITADWCATCQYNKLNVINSKSIKNLFDQYNVLKVKGDWTKPNIKIQNFLKQNNKYGIPLNIMYNKINPDGIIFSELLSEKEIFKTLEYLN